MELIRAERLPRTEGVLGLSTLVSIGLHPLDRLRQVPGLRQYVIGSLTSTCKHLILRAQESTCSCTKVQGTAYSSDRIALSKRRDRGK